MAQKAALCGSHLRHSHGVLHPQRFAIRIRTRASLLTASLRFAGTQNNVHTEVGDSEQYLRIEECWSMTCPQKVEFAALERLPKGQGKRPAEVLEALVVAIDTLNKSSAAAAKGARAEITLISNFQGETSPADAILVDAVVKQLQKADVSLEVVFLKWDMAWILPQAISRVVEMHGGRSSITTVHSYAELLSDTLRVKDTAPTTTYRGPLTITSALECPVGVNSIPMVEFPHYIKLGQCLEAL